MGFGKKTDFRSGRVLDLDKSYNNIIKPAVENAGLECIRADEIQHAGNINVPMYEQLLKADVVVADVSTYNENAFYELGVRHALKPYTTITIAEDGLKFPFDIGQIAIRQYHHLGDDIGFSEAMRMQKELAEAIRIVAKNAQTDSPVYTFLAKLRPPALPDADVAGAAQTIATQAATAPSLAPAAPIPTPAAADQMTVRALMDQVDAALDRKPADFVTAKSLLGVVRTMMPNEAYIVQKLAFATYKAGLPNTVAALREAEQLLLSLSPEGSTDTETLGLYGSVQKQLWEETRDPACMDKAIWALAKGFYVKNDYYNGINLAYMLNVHAAQNLDAAPPEAISDFILAQRMRRMVLSICQAALNPPAPAPRPVGEPEFWIKATVSQAYTGLGDDTNADQWLAAAKQVKFPPPSNSPGKEPTGPKDWMITSTVNQITKLRAMLANSPLKWIKPPEREQTDSAGT
jgi:hypothetical protein